MPETANAVFERLSPEGRFEGAPEELWGELRRRAYRALGSWARLMMRSGLCVAMRIRSKDFRKEVYVARADTPDPAAWRAEVEGLWPHLFRAAWHRRDEYPPEGVAMRFVELWPGEIAPGQRG